MMFIKITKARQHQYVQIVNSYREGNKVKHQVLYNLGRLDALKSMPSFKNVVLKLSEIVGLQHNKEGTFADSCSTAKIVNWGYLVYKNFWNKCKLEKLIDKIQSKYKVTYSLNDAWFLIVINHLLTPNSKLGIFNNQHKFLNLPQVKLNNLYRSLDIATKEQITLEKHLLSIYKKRQKKEIDIVLYDVTTFHFESVRADSLKDFGFSKNGKFNEVQVVLGLLVDLDGRPIGYELFSGNTFDSKTLEKSLKKLSKNFAIKNVIIVADRGINSKLNLASIRSKGYEYIVAARIKSMSQTLKDKILDKSDYEYLNAKEEGFCFKVLDHTNVVKDGKEKISLPEKLIATYSPKRARKDQVDRERLIEKANTLLSKPGKIKALQKRGGRKYIAKINPKDKDSWLLDEQKIKEDEKYDGYYAIQTSETNLTVEQVLSAYHSLWKIEESFRIMKSTLEVRPIFHWTEPRIKGHFVLAFLAFLLERELEFKLRQAKIAASPNDIRNTLNSMQFSEIQLNKVIFYIKSEITDLGNKILKLFGIKAYKNCISKEELEL